MTQLLSLGKYIREAPTIIGIKEHKQGNAEGYPHYHVRLQIASARRKLLYQMRPADHNSHQIIIYRLNEGTLTYTYKLILLTKSALK